MEEEAEAEAEAFPRSALDRVPARLLLVLLTAPAHTPADEARLILRLALMKASTSMPRKRPKTETNRMLCVVGVRGAGA